MIANNLKYLITMNKIDINLYYSLYDLINKNEIDRFISIFTIKVCDF
jgi:hypothetical protein